jgi:hypothetical protein
LDIGLDLADFSLETLLDYWLSKEAEAFGRKWGAPVWICKGIFIV